MIKESYVSTIAIHEKSFFYFFILNRVFIFICFYKQADASGFLLIVSVDFFVEILNINIRYFIFE